MISVEEALAHCLALATPLSSETVSLSKAHLRWMTLPAVATRDQPPFPASAMDGYAVQGDPGPDDNFLVIGEAGAGHAFSGQVGPGMAVRIFTGAPVPSGATRVIIQEDVVRIGDRIILKEGIDAGLHIRPLGQDFRAGDNLPPRRLRPNDLALLAAMNIPVVTVSRKPVVALIAGRLNGVPMLGLPGNPVSAIVCGHLFLLPMVRAMQGDPAPQPQVRQARLAVDLPATGPRAHYMRARLGPDDMITPFDRQDSALLSILGAADALLIRPVADGPRGAGSTVAYLPL